jgi:5-(aminomethyl)-3-furanmethanol phosphate kinase
MESPLEAGPGCVVVKVGGSLFDLPDLAERLRACVASLAPRHVVLIPGGGRATDVVRGLDACHALGEERSHWLALLAMSLNAQFLAAILPGTAVTLVAHDLAALRRRGTIPIVDAYAFCREDEGRPGSLPHFWQVTSDSIAARIARVLGASELVLLKSAEPPEGDWEAAARAGYVDPYFPRAVRGLAHVRAVNLRSHP